MYNDVFLNLIGSLSMHNDTCISVLDGLYMYILLTLESVSSSQLNLILWLKSIPVFMSVFYHFR